MDASAMTDTLSEFLLNLSPADVESERQAPLAKARRESFGLPAHRDMLADHGMQVQRLTGNDDPRYRDPIDERLGDWRLYTALAESRQFEKDKAEAAGIAKAEAQALLEAKRLRLKRMQPTRFTDTQLAVAMAALNGKK